MRSTIKRLGIDTAGYGLIILGVAFGWLPGPGGIPLVLAGLSLLSIHNVWARRLREYLIRHSGTLAKVLFPPNRWVQVAYDILTIVLLAVVGILAKRHAAIWQISLAIALFFVALLIASLNRDRLTMLKQRQQPK